MIGRAERDRLWEALYFSEELRKAAQYLIPNGDLWQDLLSDSIFDVLSRREDIEEVSAAGKLPSMVFMYMRNNSIRKRTAWNRQYGSSEIDSTEFGFDLCYEGEGIPPAEEPEDISPSELDNAEKLFGQVTANNVRLMRAVDKADDKKELNRKEWERAQCTKLYHDLGSYRRVSAATGIGYQQVRSRVKEFISSMTETKLNISVVTHQQQPASGMELYRLHYPYFSGVSITGQFNINQVSYQYMAEQPAGGLESDVYVFSRLQDVEIAKKVLSADKKLVIDCDDWLKLTKEHPKYGTKENEQYVSSVTATLKMAHLVTTTTQKLSDTLKDELGVESVVIKNTIPETAEQFKGEKLPHSKVRFLYMGGVFHQNDVSQMREGLKKLYADPHLKEKFQICLGGFNPNSEYRAYENTFTAEFKAQLADADYLDYLKIYTPQLDHLGYNKSYRRIWARPVSTYGEGYKEGDVALIPMAGGILFNECKSELKLIEAGMTGTAAIVSDVLPYAPHLIHEQNCLKVSPTRRDWYTQMRRLIVDEELRQEVSANLSKYVRKEFNHAKETAKLATALKGLR